MLILAIVAGVVLLFVSCAALSAQRAPCLSADSFGIPLFLNVDIYVHRNDTRTYTFLFS